MMHFLAIRLDFCGDAREIIKWDWFLKEKKSTFIVHDPPLYDFLFGPTFCGETCHKVAMSYFMTRLGRCLEISKVRSACPALLRKW